MIHDLKNESEQINILRSNPFGGSRRSAHIFPLFDSTINL